MIKMEMVCESKLENIGYIESDPGIGYIEAELTDKTNSVVLYLDPENDGFFELGAHYTLSLKRKEGETP